MIKVTGKGAGPLVAVAFLINVCVFVWTIYFICTVAGYVNAWPF